MKRKLISILVFGSFFNFPVIAVADTFIYNPIISVVGLEKSQSSNLPTASVQLSIPNGQSYPCSYPVTYATLSDLTDPYQKQVYATLMALKLNNMPIKSMQVSGGGCQIVSVGY